MAEKTAVEEAIELVDSMTDAELNKFVDYIRFTMKDRANRRNAKARAQIGIGDTVKLAGSYKPAYLNGQTGEVYGKAKLPINSGASGPVNMPLKLFVPAADVWKLPEKVVLPVE